MSVPDEARSADMSNRCKVGQLQYTRMGNLSHLRLYLLVCSFSCRRAALRACLGCSRALGSGC